MNLRPDIPWRSERIELFLLEPVHVSPAYVGWLRDALVMRYLESRFSTHDVASAAAYVRKARLNPNVLMLGIRSNGLRRHAGNIPQCADRRARAILRHRGQGAPGRHAGPGAALRAAAAAVQGALTVRAESAPGVVPS